jgi:hypothetical protein
MEEMGLGPGQQQKVGSALVRRFADNSRKKPWMVRKILWSYVGHSDLTQCVSLSLTPSCERSSAAIRPRKTYPPPRARPWCTVHGPRGRGRSVDSPSPPRRVPGRFYGPSNSSSLILAGDDDITPLSSVSLCLVCYALLPVCRLPAVSAPK